MEMAQDCNQRKFGTRLSASIHPFRTGLFATETVFRTSDSLEKKIDFDLSMLRVASRRHIFEANVNGFTLVLQVHGAKPFDDLAQQASVRLG